VSDDELKIKRLTQQLEMANKRVDLYFSRSRKYKEYFYMMTLNMENLTQALKIFSLCLSVFAVTLIVGMSQ